MDSNNINDNSNLTKKKKNIFFVETSQHLITNKKQKINTLKFLIFNCHRKKNSTNFHKKNIRKKNQN